MVDEIKEKILIIGASGLLGTALCQELSKDHNIFTPDEKELDITDAKKTESICQQLKPRVIILTAAYTDVDGCEENPELAYSINVEGVKNVAQAAKAIHAIFIYLSTDYIFNGKASQPYQEQSEPDPRSVYGRTKWQGEEVVRSILQEFIIVRSSWLFGEGKAGFVQFIFKAIGQKRALEIVSDKIGSPTYVVDLAKAIKKLICLSLQGQYDFKNNNIVHVVNSGFCSWFDMARFILDEMNCRDIELKKISLLSFPFKAQRPNFSPLDNSFYKKITGEQLRSWQDALGEFIQCQKN